LVHNFCKVANNNKWQGHRLLAVDGSVSQLPVSEELLQHFGKAHSQTKMPCVRLYQLYDVKNNITLDLLVYDRGYPVVWFYKYHMLKILISACALLKALLAVVLIPIL